VRRQACLLTHGWVGETRLLVQLPGTFFGGALSTVALSKIDWFNIASVPQTGEELEAGVND